MSWRSFIHDSVIRLSRPCLGRRHSSALRVLMFHGFTDKHHDGLENCQHKHLNIAKFEALAAHLAEFYSVLSMDDVVNRLNQGLAFPPRPVVLTFDDGFASNYHLAYPILKRYKHPAIIYLETEFVDEKEPIWVDRVDFAMHCGGCSRQELVSFKDKLKRQPQEQILAAVRKLEQEIGHQLGRVDREDVPAVYQSLDWDQVRSMHADGLISFGSHTHSHVLLGRAGPDVIRHELQESRRRIERETGHPCVHFCYPNGTPADFSETSEQILLECGFHSSITTVGGFNTIPCSPFLLRRIGMTNDLTPKQFEQYLAVGDASMRGMLNLNAYLGKS